MENVDSCYSINLAKRLISTTAAAALYEDGCSDVTVTIESETATKTSNCDWSITRTYKISDACGKYVTKTQTISGGDHTNPVIGDITLPAIVNAGNCQYSIPSLEAATIAASSDNCSATVTWVGQTASPAPDAGDKYNQTDVDRTITVTVTVKDDCNNTISKDVTYTIPKNDLTLSVGVEDTICFGATANLTATATSSNTPLAYSWTPTTGVTNPSQANTTVAPAAGKHTYRMTVTDNNGCTLYKDTTVNVREKLTLSVNPGTHDAYCKNESTVDALTVTPAGGSGHYSYTWTMNDGTTTSTVGTTNTITPSTATVGTFTYTVEVIDQAGCGDSTREVKTIVINPLPTLTVSPTSQSICPGGAITTINIAATNATTTIDNVRLTPNGGAEAASDLATLGLTSSPAVNPTSITGNVTAATGDVISFTVTATSGYGCGVLTEDVTITIGDTNIVTYTIDTCDHYVWRHDGNPTYNTTGVYRFGSFTDHNGCDSVTYLNLTIRTDPTPTVDDKTICLGSTATLTVTSDYDEYQWNTGDVTQSIEQTPTAVNTYDYSVTVTQYYSDAAHCQGTATAHIIVQDTVNLAVTNATQTHCLGETITPIEITYANGSINATALQAAVEAIGLTWTAGAGTATISGKPTPANASAYTFTVTATSQYNAPACDTKEKVISILVNDTVVPSFSTARDLCTNTSLANDSIEISVQALAGYTYTWNIDGGSYATSSPHAVNGTSDTNKVVVRWATDGDKVVRFTFRNNTTGCEGTDTLHVHVHPTPTVSIGTVTENICPFSGSYDHLTATVVGGTANYTYTWGGGVALTPATTTTATLTNEVVATIPTTSCDTTYKVGVNVVDNHGCKANADSITLTVKDVDVPTFTRPADKVLYKDNNCNYDIRVAVTDSVTSTHDNCTPQANLIVGHHDEDVTPADSCMGLTIIERSWYAIDQCGNRSNAADSVQTIRIRDNKVPNISGTLRDSTVVGCDGDSRPVADNTLQYLRTHGLTISDNCSDDAHLTVTSSDGEVSGTCDKTILRTYRVTDDCGNYSEATQTLHITFPAFPTPEDGGRTVPCEVDAVPPTPPTVTLCGSNYTAEPYPNATDYRVSTVVNGEGTVTYNYRYTDCHDSYNWKYVYEVQADAFDSIEPKDTTVVCPANVLSRVQMESTKRPTITVCNAVVPWEYDSTSTTISQSCGDSVYHYHYVVNGRTYRWTYTTHVVPNDFADIMPENGQGNINCAVEALVAGEAGSLITLPTVTNHCDTVLNAPVLKTGYPTPAPACNGDIEYVYTYSDCAGHTNDWTFTYHINQPDFTMPDNDSSTVECVADAYGAGETGCTWTLPEVKSYCQEVLIPVDTVRSDEPDCEGRLTYTYKYRDCAGHEHNWVYIYRIDHTVAPTVNATGYDNESTVTCANLAQPLAAMYVPNARNSCGENIEAVLTDSTITNIGTGCDFDKKYTYTYTDCDETLKSYWYYTYHVRLPEEIAAVPANGTDVRPCAVDAVKPGAPTIQDVCGRDIVPVYLDSTAAMNPDGTGTVTHRYTYTDCAGHDSVWSYVYTINPADFSLRNNDTIAINCPNQAVEAQYAKPAVTVCGVVITPTYSDSVAVNAGGCGTIVHRWTYRVNDADYVWRAVFQVSPADFADVMPENGQGNIDCAAEALAAGETGSLITLPTVTNHCDTVLNAPVLKAGYPTAAPACNGDIEYVYTYSDCAGHTNDWTFTYHINQPDFTMPDNDSSTVECVADAYGAGETGCTWTLPEVKSYCQEVLIPVDTVRSDEPDCEGRLTYTYKYRDCAGHEHNWVYIYRIDHTVAPTVNATGYDNESTVTCANLAQPLAAMYVPNARNSCGENIEAVLTDSTITNIGTGCDFDKKYTYTYTDCDETLKSYWYYTYHVRLPEEIAEVPADVTTTKPCAIDAVKPVAATIHDVCEREILPVYVDSVATMNANGTGTVVHTFRYTDCAGHDSVWTYTYNIDPADFDPLDSLPIAIHCPAEALESAYTVPTVTVCGATVSVTGPRVVNAVNAGGCGHIYHEYDYSVNAVDYVWVVDFTIDIEDFVTLMPENGQGNINCAVEALAAGETGSLITLPTVTNHCDTVLNAPVLKAGYPTAAPACNGDIEYVYTYSDCAGHTNDWTFTYHINQPDFTMPDNDSSTVECVADAYGAGETGCTWTLPEVKSYCQEVLIPVDTVRSDEPDCEGRLTYTYKYRDCAGHEHNWVYIYRIDHTVAPTVNATGYDNESTVTCANLAQPLAAMYVPNARNSCGENIEAVLTDSTITNIGTGCDFDKKYTYTYTDCDETLKSYWYYTYHVRLPEIIAEVPADGADVRACAVDAVNPGAVTIHDVCGREIVPVYTDSISAMNPDGTGTITHTYTYTDCAGHDSVWSYVYTINPADFSLRDNDTIDIHCTTEAVEALYTKPTPTVCGVTVPVTGPVVTNEVTAGGCGKIIHTWTYTVNTVDYNWSAVFIVSPDDFADVMPENGQGNIDCAAEALAAGEAGSLITLPTVTNHCDTVLNAPVLKAGYPTAAPACNGDIEYVYTYSDCAGHTNDWTFTYHINQPDFTMPDNDSSIVECVADAYGAGETGCTWTLPVVKSYCQEVLIPVDTVRSDEPDCEGRLTYTYKYRDCAGHEHNWVYIYRIDHTVAPTVNATGFRTDSTVVCANLAQPLAAMYVPNARNSCGENIEAVITDSLITQVGTGCDFDKMYTYTYTDCDETLKSYWYFTYHVRLPEVIAEVPADVTDNRACAVDATNPGAVTIHDVCGREIVPVLIADSVPAMNPDGTGTVTYQYRYTDCAGHDSTWTYTYVVNPETFTRVPDDTVEVRCVSEIVVPSTTGTPRIPTVTVCGVEQPLVLTSTSNTVTAGGCGDSTFTYTYTVNAVDYTWSYTYRISPDMYEVPQNDGTNVECLSEVSVPTAPVVTNNCDSIIPSTLFNSDTNWTIDNCEGTIAFTYRYEDCVGREGFWTYTYTIDRTTAPHQNGNVETRRVVACMGDTAAPTVLPEVEDVCGNILPAPAPVVTMPTNSCQDSVKYTYTYVDCSGLEYVWTYSYIVKDTIAPTINPIAAQSAVPAGNCQFSIPDLSQIVVDASTDNCNGAVTFVRQVPSADSLVAQLRTAQTFPTTVTVTDECGNEQSITIPVTVQANDVYVNASSDVAICLNESTRLTATGGSSNEGTPSYEWTPANGLSATTGTVVVATPADTTTYTVTITDGNGCQASDDVTVTIYPLVVLTTGDPLDQVVCAGGNMVPVNVHYEHASVAVTGLPSGITYNASSSVVSGHPNASGNYVITATSLYGCPTETFEGNITVADTIITRLAETACDTYTWETNGGTYTTTGTYRWSTTTESGCDSVVYLALTVNYQSFGIDYVTECDSYTWDRGNGQTYTASTTSPTYVFRNGNAVGCDSTVTLYLTIHYSNTGDTSALECDRFEWYGQTYTSDAEPTHMFTNMWGCDSLVTLHLTIKPTYIFRMRDSLCEGDVYHFHGDSYTETGSYSHVYHSIYGCDSTYTVDLIVLPTLVITIDQYNNCDSGYYRLMANSQGDQYHWSARPHHGELNGQADNQIIRVAPPEPTTYTVTASYGDNHWCPQSESISVEEFIVPIADMTVRPNAVTLDNPTWYADYHTHGFLNYITYEWFVNGSHYHQQTQHIQGNYQAHPNVLEDSVEIMLIATSGQCADTSIVAIPYRHDCIFVPNVFTPGSSSNNLWGPVGNGIIEMEVWVYNREGLIVFHSTSSDEYWDGKHQGTNADCPTAAYTYRVNYRYDANPEALQTKVGTVTLLR